MRETVERYKTCASAFENCAAHAQESDPATLSAWSSTVAELCALHDKLLVVEGDLSRAFDAAVTRQIAGPQIQAQVAAWARESFDPVRHTLILTLINEARTAVAGCDSVAALRACPS